MMGVLICIIVIIWLILVEISYLYQSPRALIILIKVIASHYSNVSEFNFLLKI